MKFGKFSESTAILKIGQSQVCIGGGVLKVGLLKYPHLYIYPFMVFEKYGGWKIWWVKDIVGEKYGGL